ncbi:MAG TPA: lysoplasmalogenase [Actinobacteria bacterium]|nr:YhhN-like protein [bacterium BMS3Bbin01]HDH24871.1 lysoplasmalogenase [Actinomycetota bacterium]
MTWVFTAMTVLALMVLLSGERGNVTLRNLAKPVASAGFVGVALSAGALDTNFGTWIFLGLVLGASGDVLLLGASQTAFLVGLVAFLLGNVAYIAAFFTLGVDSGVSFIAGSVALVVAALVFVWLRPHLPTAMVGPVIGYIAVISTMLVVAVGATASGATPMLLAGAVAFYLSDLSVARDRFVAPGFVNRVWGLPLYYAGQLLIAWSVISVSN